MGLFLPTLYVGLEWSNVRKLQKEYPWVIDRGDLPPEIKFSKSKPPAWVPLSQVSPIAVTAIRMSEDWAFYQHPGFDVDQMMDALKKDLREGRFARGASTITQQVARNLFLSQEKTLFRKIREIIVAICLEKQLGKRKILEIYLNIAEWGPAIYGIESASHYYFQKEPLDLGAKEGAFLAMLLPSPKRYSQSFVDQKLTPYAKSTIENILTKMWNTHVLSEKEFTEEMSKSLFRVD